MQIYANKWINSKKKIAAKFFLKNKTKHCFNTIFKIHHMSHAVFLCRSCNCCKRPDPRKRRAILMILICMSLNSARVKTEVENLLELCVAVKYSHFAATLVTTIETDKSPP